jgi:15-cis-phytoene synthase
MNDTDIAQCGLLLRGGSRSFHAASLVLPRGTREAATALYAFCRLADDAIDGSCEPARELDALTGRLRRIYAGRPDGHPADRAFASIVERFDIPPALPQALLDGFHWDAQARRYECLEDLCGYGARVAGSVGVMMTLLMKQRDPAVLACASDLGVAMQLTNIARDVGEDARAGRLYLPLRWLRDAGIDADEFVRHPQFCPALAGVVERLLAAADALYGRSAQGIAYLPGACRFGIHAARALYREIGNEIARRDFDSVSQRAVVSAADKLRALAAAAAASFAAPQALQDAALLDSRFLIDAVGPSRIRAEAAFAAEPAPAWWNLKVRLLRLLDLFERLERREGLPGLGLEEQSVA